MAPDFTLNATLAKITIKPGPKDDNGDPGTPVAVIQLETAATPTTGHLSLYVTYPLHVSLTPLQLTLWDNQPQSASDGPEAEDLPMFRPIRSE